MKFKHTQLTVLSLFSLLSLALIYGCKKEDPLKPNEDMEKFQTEDYAGGGDIGGGFGDTTSTGGGNGGGNGNSSTFFRASINGSNISFPARTYTSSSTGVTINASEGLGGVKEISFDLLNQPTVGDTIRLTRGEGRFLERIGIVYSSISGYIVFDQIEIGYVEGKFAFIGEMINNPDSSVTVTNGEFYINR